jgi:hypothetical protein
MTFETKDCKEEKRREEVTKKNLFVSFFQQKNSFWLL